MATNDCIAASTNRNTVFQRFSVVDTSHLVSDQLSSAVAGYPTFRNKAYDSLFTFLLCSRFTSIIILCVRVRSCDMAS